MTIRHRLADLLNAALEQGGFRYRCTVDSVHRNYAGFWQRASGACTWFADCRQPELPDGPTLTVVSWDRMTTCVRYGIALQQGEIDVEADARTPENGFIKARRVPLVGVVEPHSVAPGRAKA